MEANELRIGNYINLKDKGLYQIFGGHDIETIDDWNDTDYCTGVVLSEEWLLKFGFNVNKLTYRYCIKDSSYEVVKFGERYVFDLGSMCIAISYVHQLQNLYFALKGEELQYTKITS